MEQNVKFLPKHKKLVPQGHVQVNIQNPKEKQVASFMKMIDEWITGNFHRMENFCTNWGDVKRIKFTYLLGIFPHSHFLCRETRKTGQFTAFRWH